MKTPIILGHFIVAGTMYQPASGIAWHTIDRETSVRLVRERFNPHDPLAISVRADDITRLGYIRRDDNRVLSALMDQGVALSARIVEIQHNSGSRHPDELQVEVSLSLEDTGSSSGRGGRRG